MTPPTKSVMSESDLKFLPNNKHEAKWENQWESVKILRTYGKKFIIYLFVYYYPLYRVNLQLNENLWNMLRLILMVQLIMPPIGEEIYVLKHTFDIENQFNKTLMDSHVKQ